MMWLFCLVLLLNKAQADSPPADLPVIDHIIVHKAARTLELYAEGRLLWRIERIQLGFSPVGGKRVQGDGKTPEGHYTIDGGNLASRYDLALHISYPNAADSAMARSLGRPPGGQIFIHGQPNDWDASKTPDGRIPGDWTDGCIALANDEIEALWRVTPDGTPIDIEP